MSTVHLPNLHTSPPGEWRYKVPETGQSFHGSNWPQLQEQLVAHYRATGYAFPEDLFARVEAYICANAPDYCEGVPADAPRFSLGHSFTTVVQGTKTLAHWLLTGRRYVDQEVANRRALTCSGCVYNLEPQGCNGCNANVMKEAVALVVGKRATPHDERLKACRICGCDLRAKTHIPHAIIVAHMPADQQAQLPSHCWVVMERDVSTLAHQPIPSSP